MGYIEELGKAFAAAGGKKLSEGGTAAGNVAILNSLGMGDFQTISGGGFLGAIKDILPGGNSMLVDPVLGYGPAVGEVDLLTGPAINIQGLIGTGLGILQNLTAPQGAIGPIFDPIQEVTTRQAQIQSGLTKTIQGKCAPARRRFKVVLNAEGQPTVISVCPPRRMNPLNPKALGRAARRLGSFQRIASHIEKTIQKACRTKSRRSSSRSYCPPSRCR